VLTSLELAVRHIQAREAPPDPAVLDALTLALEGVHRVRRTVRMLGVFSGAPPERREPVDLRSVLTSVTELARYAVSSRARLVVDLGEVPPVHANEARLCEALLNVTISAANAIPEGRPQDNEVRVATWTEGDWAVAEIADTGRGVAPEDLPRVFHPFFARRPELVVSCA
jgi:C4-dicarboxylate-specific signal transduction histidine kinase